MGHVFTPRQQLLLYSSTDWEAFVEEWAQYQKHRYVTVTRIAGANDVGIDVAAFADQSGLNGVWDNFQCKHYRDPITSRTAMPEIAKCLWYSYQKLFRPPRHYYFVAPKDVGPTLKLLLLRGTDLKDCLIRKWDNWCARKITSTGVIPLSGSFRDYVDSFDFSVFTFKPTLELIREHQDTPYYAARFGGGLDDRPTPEKPPAKPHTKESRYLQQLLEAYSDHKKLPLMNPSQLSAWRHIEDHYHRQREFFYHAESLKSFARDTVPAGTFEDLQDEVHAGVIDTSTVAFADALARLNAVTQAASNLGLTANGLISVVRVQDRRGICHQLANDNRLRWKV